MKQGSYVLCSKYKDGDCKDPWYVGFLIHSTSEYGVPVFIVCGWDSKRGLVHFRGRRVQRLRKEQGEALLSSDLPALSDQSIYKILKIIKNEQMHTMSRRGL